MKKLEEKHSDVVQHILFTMKFFPLISHCADGQTDQRTDGRTKRGVESRSTRLMTVWAIVSLNIGWARHWLLCAVIDAGWAKICGIIVGSVYKPPGSLLLCARGHGFSGGGAMRCGGVRCGVVVVVGLEHSHYSSGGGKECCGML